MKTKAIVIVGPTASGKTAIGIKIAKQINGEIISFDSRQIYRGMDIGTAKPEGKWVNVEIQKGCPIDQLFGARRIFLVDDVPHWGIDLADPDDTFSAARFKEYARKKINEIVSRNHVPILVGGTGFWLKVLVDNLDLALIAGGGKLRSELEARALGDLFHEFELLDPIGARVIDKQNKRRVIRALEVTKLAGVPWSEQQTATEPLYDVLQIGMAVPRKELNERIEYRVDRMVAKGLVDEARALKDTYGCDIESMTGIGYRQICRFLSGHQSLSLAIEEIKRDTRQYAKRQITWFKRDERIHWVDSMNSIKSLVEDFLKN